jgi:hypothetical protein
MGLLDLTDSAFERGHTTAYTVLDILLRAYGGTPAGNEGTESGNMYSTIEVQFYDLFPGTKS